MKHIIIALCVFCVIFLLASHSARAQSKDHYPIGEVVAIEGKAFLRNDENRIEAKENAKIYMNTVIETDKASKIMVLFIDDTNITLGAEAELLIDDYVFDPFDAEENEASFEVLKGAFQWTSGMLSKREQPQVHITTQTGSIGIRGTEFWAGEVEDGYGLFVDNGLVFFEGYWGGIEIPAGEGAFIKPDEPAIKPTLDFWAAERRKYAKVRTTIKTVNLSARLNEMMKQNIQKRNNYRGVMFPYKENPYMKSIIRDGDQFYTDEFEERIQSY